MNEDEQTGVEQMGRQIDALEAKHDELMDEVSSLEKERDTLQEELDAANEKIENLRAVLADVQTMAKDGLR